MDIKLIEELADFEKVYTHSQYCIFSSDANSYVHSIDMPSIALLSEINNLNSRWAGWLSRAKLAEPTQDKIDAERYRFIRSQTAPVHLVFYAIKDKLDIRNHLINGELDNAIDAAISKDK